MNLDEPEWISGEPLYHAVFETLLAFINSALGDSEAWPHRINQTIASLRPLGTQAPTAEEYKVDSRVLYAILLTMVKQFEPATTAHDDLVKLVLTIRNMPMPPTVIQTINKYDRNNEIHIELTTFIGAYSSFEQDAPLHPPLDERPSSIIFQDRPPWRLPHYRSLEPLEWASLNAFIAKIHAAEPEIPKLDVRGLFAMIEALEEVRTGAELEDLVSAASAWVIYAGPALRSNDIPYVCYPTESKRMPWSRGELWKGRHALSEERWQFWLQRFREIAERADVSDVVRTAALRAVEAGSGA
ncbi:hypothetical protein B0A48_13099 [Cryoendolithus antarcticus]|uniref:Uncharacterized protein n=1 Tax=Cryoendolithus antarcticus TaxID=1507870 RepID=A0A1V8SNB1_9PEZI|nr:hypothetical protein B0A48_13099 [Cryoendolithus antarcticus]